MENATKIIRKRKSWADDGEVAILDVWAERVSDLRGARKNGHVYKEMSAELNKLGYNYNARDIQVKFANFTQRYRKEKMAMGPSSGSPSTWPFYGTVHQIIGGFKINVFNQLAIQSAKKSGVGGTSSQNSYTFKHTVAIPTAKSSDTTLYSADDEIALRHFVSTLFKLKSELQSRSKLVGLMRKCVLNELS